MINKLIIDKIKDIISQIEGICIAYIFGSSLKNNIFNDIDIGIVISDLKSPYQMLKFAMNLAKIFERKLDYKWEFDIKILNSTPIYFQHSVIKNGELLFYRNELERINYEESVLNSYLDYKDTLDWFKIQIIGRD